ncbi:hypothetical protein H4582DRAFT_2131737 [Lactarius indigo]|nr:hypothetical protein H4582DRAFT_2131737 [Lactarius indigo]
MLRKVRATQDVEESDCSVPDRYLVYVRRGCIRPELQRIIDACESAGTETAPHRTTDTVLPFSEDWVPPNVLPALASLSSHGSVSLLRLTILTLFWIQDAADDPLTRTVALCSLVSAYSCTAHLAGPRKFRRWRQRFSGMSESCSHYRAFGSHGRCSPSSLRSCPSSSTLAPEARHNRLYHHMRSSARGSGSRAKSVYFILVIRTFRNYGEVGRNARVVQRLAEVQVELETWTEWTRDREQDDAGARARVGEDGTREEPRGRSRASDGAEPKMNPPGNELRLSGLDREQEAGMPDGGGLPTNDSYSSLGM